MEDEEEPFNEDEIDFDAEDEADEDEVDLKATAKRRRRWLVGLLLIAAAGVLIVAAIISYQSHAQSVAAAQIGDAPIRPNMTLADLRRALGPETVADKSVDSGMPVDNSIDFQFGHGIVVATFLGKDPKAVPSQETPIQITILPAFKGTVCGVHTADTLIKALALVHANYPGMEKSADYDTEHEVDLDGTWTLTFEPQEQDGQQRAGGMILKDSQWGTALEDNGP